MGSSLASTTGKSPPRSNIPSRPLAEPWASRWLPCASGEPSIRGMLKRSWHAAKLASIDRRHRSLAGQSQAGPAAGRHLLPNRLPDPWRSEPGPRAGDSPTPVDRGMQVAVHQLDHWNSPAAVAHRNYTARSEGEAPSASRSIDDALAIAEQIDF